MGKKIKSKVAGVTRGKRQDHIRKHCKRGKSLILKREPKNRGDPNAISVWVKAGILGRKVQIGYLNKRLAKDLAPIMDGGRKVSAKITEVTGGTKSKPTRGVNIEVSV